MHIRRDILHNARYEELITGNDVNIYLLGVLDCMETSDF